MKVVFIEEMKGSWARGCGLAAVLILGAVLVGIYAMVKG